MYQMYTEMVKASMMGVEKVIYLPSNGESSPMNFFPFMGGMIPGMGNMPPPLAKTVVKKD
jgi:hypothetical protein